MEKRIALVTCSKYPELTASDRILAEALRERCSVPVAADWRDASVRWQDFDLAVVRSTWDYHLHPDEFTAWIDRIAGETRLVNSPDLVRWNSSKRYLVDLAKRGVALLPTLLVAPGGEPPYRGFDHSGWDNIVVKPLVGASAWQIARTTPEKLADLLTPELRDGGYLIQPYAREIEDGEYSIMFFDGRFSHAILKTPRSGEFRTQPELGAIQTVVQPAEPIVRQAASVLDALPERPTYARIDGILQDGRFVLMEAELIEPELFFRLAPAAAQTFALALLALTSSN